VTTPPGTGRDSAGRADVRAAAESIGHRGHAVFALDAAGRLTYWNPQAAALSGWSPETALGRPLYDLLVGRSRLELGEGLDLLAAGRAWVADLDVEGPRGKAVRVEVWAEPVRAGGAGGPVCGSVAVLRSLSAGHRLHELTAVLRTVPDAVVVVDDKGLVRDWNPAAERMFGWSRGEVLGSHVERLVPETERLAFHAVWERLVAGVEVPAYEARRQGPDGETRLVGVHAAAFREKGSFAGAVATFRELSPRQQEDRLLADLVAGIPVVVAAYDGQGRVTVGAGGGYLRAGVAPALAHGTDLLAVLPDGSPLHVAVTASLRGAESQLQVQFDDRVWQCHVGTLPEGGFVSAVDVTGEQVMGDRMRALLAAAPLAFVTFDASARITYAAGSSFAAMNVDPQDLVGLRLLDVWGDDPQISEAVVRCLTGVHVDLVVEYAERVWDLHYRCYRDARGTVTGGVCMAQDATGWVVARTGRCAACWSGTSSPDCRVAVVCSAGSTPLSPTG
jgi:PAS domain S-box-containing protein